MFTPSHIIVNLAFLGSARTQRYPAIIWGALLPDLPIFIMAIWERFVRFTPWETIWDIKYFEPHWQNFIDIFNSIPLILILLTLGLYKKWPALTFLTASMLLHIAFDLPVHTADAHRHFWPLSNFRFHSPLSYWDPTQGGNIMNLIEFGLVIIASFRIYPYLKTAWSKGLILLTNLFYLVTLMFMANTWQQYSNSPTASIEPTKATPAEPQSSPQF